jgi:hypothetical protein
MGGDEKGTITIHLDHDACLAVQVEHVGDIKKGS